MTAEKNRFAIARRIVWLAAAGLVLFTAVRLAVQGEIFPSAQAAQAQPKPAAKAPAHAETHSDAAFETALRKAMDAPVDVFLDVIEVQEQKPFLPGVKFDGLVDVTGKHLLRFTNDKNERWLIDPDTVLAFRVGRAKSK